jgi:hypothetical protein
MGSIFRTPLWPWAKVVLVLVAIDLGVFRTGWFFRVVPQFEKEPVTWGLVYRSVRVLAEPKAQPVAYAVGSSIVFLGLDEARVRQALEEREVPTGFSALTVFGANGVDQALLAHAAAGTRPWLVVLTASVRDFPATGSLDTPVSRAFLDSTVDFPPLRPTTADGRLAAMVASAWQLYRNRIFIRLALRELVAPVVDRVWPAAFAPVPRPADVVPTDVVKTAPVPEEAARWFFPGRITSEAFTAWQHWRGTRRFEDYATFLRLSKSAAIEQYGRQTLATHGPDGNVHFEALAWAMRELHAAGIRVLVLDFPENPVLRAPEARETYDTALADAVAARLAADAAVHGARFVDLRDALDGEDFYDLIHPNIQGSWKLSTRLGELVAEEWHAARP